MEGWIVKIAEFAEMAILTCLIKERTTAAGKRNQNTLQCFFLLLLIKASC